MARHPLTAATEDAPLSSECFLDPDARQRGVDANAKSAGNAQRLQLSATAPHHREVVSRGGHKSFVMIKLANMSQYVVFEIVTHAMIECVFEYD